jgi:serine/threonine protein kinase
MIAAQILRALGAAHELGIVHRDIKPANVFITEPELSVKVLDFGIAKALGEDGEDLVTKLTATGAILGSPAYMAPEQVRGLTIRPGVDLYSLGIVMAELLSGQRLIEATTPIDALMMHVSDSELVLPDAARTSLLGSVIERAVKKKPEERFASAREMLAALDPKSSEARGGSVAGSRQSRVAPTAPDHAPEPTMAAAPLGHHASIAATVDQPPALPRRRSGLWLGIAALALVGGGAAAFWSLSREEPDDDDVARDDDDADDRRRRRRRAPTKPSTKPPPATPPPPKPQVLPPWSTPQHPPAHEDSGDLIIAAITEQHIRIRLEEAGYKVTSTHRSTRVVNQKAYRTLVLDLDDSPPGVNAVASVRLETFPTVAARTLLPAHMPFGLGGGLNLVSLNHLPKPKAERLMAILRRPPVEVGRKKPSPMFRDPFE